jgi:sulfide:quinone oxidoreductase
LIWVPSNKVDESQLRIPLDNFFSRKNIQFIEGEVTGLYDEGRSVLVGEKIIKNDALIIASGGRFIKKLPGIENSITPCEGLPGLVKVRDQLKQMKGGKIAIGFSGNPNEPSAMRGGPMFEFLFGLDTQLRKENEETSLKLLSLLLLNSLGLDLVKKQSKAFLKK